MYWNTLPCGCTTGNSNVRENHFALYGGNDLHRARNCTNLWKDKVILTKFVPISRK